MGTCKTCKFWVYPTRVKDSYTVGGTRLKGCELLGEGSATGTEGGILDPDTGHYYLKADAVRWDEQSQAFTDSGVFVFTDEDFGCNQHQPATDGEG